MISVIAEKLCTCKVIKIATPDRNAKNKVLFNRQIYLIANNN